ncbi:MAG: GIY-YIG nuclease family protein [Patescibacteria group bacterium]|nr:GIY-YIG nuclease family protein [Patescibacteria group bacterium]
MPYFVYLMECTDGSLYTGITTNLERRFEEHVSRHGGNYTRAHKARRIVYTEEYPSRSEALKREAEIKSWQRKKKLMLIKK